MGPFKDCLVVLTLTFNVIIILVSFISLAESSSRSSETIKFENGVYNDIIIAVDENNVPAGDCPKLLETLKEVIPEFSKSLYEATGGRSAIGKVNLLLPRHWNFINCNFPNSSYFNPADPNLSYNAAHIQITKDHPLATSLPWTRQYKPCGQEGDSIVLPLPFLQNNSTSFSKLIKGRLLLHEWTKFRYGAFDEIGYIEEGEEGGRQDLFNPCYMYYKQAQFTSCTAKRLPSIALNKSACSLEFLGRQAGSLETYFMQSNTSIMSSPYLENVAHYCDGSTHNLWAATKQNLYCRKSVSEVVNSHSDFKNTYHNPNSLQNPAPPEIKILQHELLFKTAYAFVVDNSKEMHDEFKNVHVKQAITEFVELLNVGTMVHLTVFNHGETKPIATTTLGSDIEKKNFLMNIPEMLDPSPGISRTLLPVMEGVINELNNHKNFAWNVLIFSDSTVNVKDMSSAIDKFHDTPHSLSIFTFESESATISEDWLDWYRIANTRNVMVLPYCRIPEFAGGPCNIITSIFIVDHLIGLLNEQEDKPRFIQKVSQVVISNDANQVVNFELDHQSALVQRVYFFFPLAQPLADGSEGSSFVKLIPPESSECKVEPLLNYGGVLTFDKSECAYKSGLWTLKIERKIPPGIGQQHLDVFVEYAETVTDRLLVTSSLGQTDLTQGLTPNTNLTSIFVHLSLPEGNPILSADVQLRVFYPFLVSSGQGYIPVANITLKDDGNSNSGADQTANDGIYSGYLWGYSRGSPSYHITQIRVTTTDNTKVLETIEPPNAAFLKSEMREKCCGKVIRPSSTRPLQAHLKFQTLHLGFKTVDPWTEIAAPPGSIGTIAVTGENDTHVTIQFDSVPGDVMNNTVSIQSIQACCVTTSEADEPPGKPDETQCRADTVECETFRDPGTKQTCVSSKQKLVTAFVPSTDENNVNLLICGLRVFSSNSESKVSAGDFRVSLPNELLVKSEPKCDNIHDGCLPMLIFWIMIGSIAFLLLLLLILIIIWICTSRGKKTKPESTPIKTPASVYIPPKKQENKSIINPPDDTESVEYTTVTCETGRRQDQKADEPNVVKELFVNHAYIQNEDGDLKIIADNGKILRRPLVNMESSEPVTHYNPIPARRIQEVAPADNMQVYKPEPQTHRGGPPVPQSRERSIKPPYHQRPRIVHQNPMLRSDSEQQLNAIPTSPTTPINYATISRAGRIRELSGIGTAGQNQVKVDPHYMTPHNYTMPVKNNKPQRRDPIPTTFRPRPPPQILPYPASDTDSTVYDVVRKPPTFARPPPYPAGSKLVNGNPNLQTSAFTGGRTPKSISSAGSPPLQAPIPPPRYDISRNIGTTPKSTASHYPSRQQPEDEDSDEWDDGDNEYYMGVSYA